MILGVSGYNFNINIILKIYFTMTNRADPDEMPHHAAFNMGLHCKSTCSGVSQIQRVILYLII